MTNHKFRVQTFLSDLIFLMIFDNVFLQWWCVSESLRADWTQNLIILTNMPNSFAFDIQMEIFDMSIQDEFLRKWLFTLLAFETFTIVIFIIRVFFIIINIIMIVNIWWITFCILIFSILLFLKIWFRIDIWGIDFNLCWDRSGFSKTNRSKIDGRWFAFGLVPNDVLHLIVVFEIKINTLILWKQQ